MTWATNRLRYVADLNPPVRADLNATKNLEVSFLPMEAVGEDGSLSLERVRPVSEVRNGYSYFEDGDVAFAKVTPCFENGKGALMQGLELGAGFGTSELTVFRPRPGTDARFLNYVLRSQQFRQHGVGAMTGAGGLKRVPDDFVRDYKTPWPSLDEQELLANFLDAQMARIDALTAEKMRLVERLTEFRKSVISEVTTRGLNKGVPTQPSGQAWLGEIPAHWKLSKLKHLGEAIIGLTYSPEDVTTADNGVLVLRSSNVQGGRIALEDNVYVTCSIPSRLRVQAGDILICSRNGSRALIGKNAVIEPEHAGLTFGAFMTVFRSPDNFYIRWLLNSPLFDFHSASFLTSTINQLTTGNLNGLVVPLPPEKERREIDAYLSIKSKQISVLLEHTEQHIDRLREYRSSLISAAVTGQLDIGSFKAKLPEAA